MEERTNTEFPTTGSSQYETWDQSHQEEWSSAVEGNPSGGRAHHFASESRERARKVSGMAKGRFIKMADQRKSHLAAELESFAGTLDDLSRKLEDKGTDSQQKLTDGASQLVRRTSRMLRENSSEQLLDRAEGELRERPGIALAGAIALGFLGVRMLRS